jgi:hypothetical protein
MLFKIPPDKIGDAWDLLRPFVIPALPKQDQIDSEQVGNILFALLTEKAHLWAYYRKGERELAKPRAILITTDTADAVARRVSLLVYTVVAIDELSPQDYSEAVDALYSYAEGRGMSDVVAYVGDQAARLWASRGATKVSNFMRL